MNTSIFSHKPTGMKITGIALILALLLGLALLNGFTPTARADYATGGAGQHIGDIFWMDWVDSDFAEGNTKIFTLPGNIVVQATISNIGPGLGNVGPTDNYAAIPTIGKWFLSFLMLIGRLELMAVYVLFSVAFWRH